MNVAFYTRVSTLQQTVEPQLIELKAYAAQRGWMVVEQHSDTISGSKADRPGLAQLMEGVRAKRFEAVLAVKLDRMARSLVHFGKLADEFLKHGVALILTSQGIDTSASNPCGKFQQNILAAVAEFERDLIRERTRAGLAAARARGAVLGRCSPTMPAAPERRVVLTQWSVDGLPGGYPELARRLGGVSRATAMREWKRQQAAPKTPA